MTDRPSADDQETRCLAVFPLYPDRGPACLLTKGHDGEHRLGKNVSWTDEWAREVSAQREAQVRPMTGRPSADELRNVECPECGGAAELHFYSADASHVAGCHGDEFDVLAAAWPAPVVDFSSIPTHNGTPVTPENLRWAATHQALCNSWIFDVLTGLADQIEGKQG